MSTGTTTIEEDDAASRGGLSKARAIALTVTVTGAAFLNTMGVQIIVLVLPTVGRDYDIPDSRQQWIVAAYSLTFGCFLMLWGRLADVFGRRLIFIIGSAWLTAASIATPFMPSEIAFDVFRGLQGLASFQRQLQIRFGAAANVPTAIGILGSTFPPGQAKNFAFSCYGGGAPMGAVFGNLLGGLVGQYASWHWLFWITAIFAGAITVAGIILIPKPPPNVQRPSVKDVDWIGGFLVTASLLALLAGLTEGNVVGWSTAYIPVLLVLFAVLMAAFILWQWFLEKKTSRKPLVKITIFKNGKFSAAMVIMCLFFSSFNNYIIFATYFYQEYLGLSLIQTFLRFLPMGVVGLCVIFVMAQVISRVRGIYILAFSNISVSISCLLLAVPIPPSTIFWAYGFPAMILAVWGADTLVPTLTLFVAQSLPQEDQAMGGALINAAGQMGRAIGLAIATAIETAVIASEENVDIQEVGNSAPPQGSGQLLDGLHAAQWTNFAFAIAALVVVVAAFRGAGKVGHRSHTKK
ncbi:MFS general substrate transporter [Aulographum hederae CBS 113979]|uniref:MFS general substrate transporter n=1 Tax=Aulographum hederae CBS 113979 TaxID=1176131 RepID=A0A6G1H976_9PEZI|nr:MFS general substrate transporter [Aulographum hederae CBS 113979]